MNNDKARIKYADIIGLPYRKSTERKHMSPHDRAAQFSSFAALSGYEDMVAEEARLTDSETELSESMIEIIDSTIGEIGIMISNGAHPAVTVTYFKPDKFKRGGSYETVTAIIKKIDTIGKKLILCGSDDIDDKRIPVIGVPIEKISGLTIVNRNTESDPL